MLKRMFCFVLCIVLIAGLVVFPVGAETEEMEVSQEYIDKVVTEYEDPGDYMFYEREPNDSTGTADRVYSDYTISGSAGLYDLDYFKFTLSERSTVILVGASSYTTIYFGINDSNDKALYAYQPTTLSSSTYTFAASVTLSAGTYYLCVLSSNAVSYSKSYLAYLEYTAVPHTHSYKDATCTEPKTCTICGGTSGSALGHIYSNDCDASCNRCGVSRDVPGHSYTNDCDPTCNRCGETREVPDHVYLDDCDATCEICQAERTAPHSYLDDCDESCELCQFVRVAPHSYDNDCDDTCNLCGVTRVPGEHTYDHGCDPDCNVCGATREVSNHVYDNPCDKTCNICQATRTVGAHKYSNNCDTTCNYCQATRKITHTYKKTTVKATLSKNGSVTQKCSVCGKTGTKTTIAYVKTIKLSATSFAYDKKAKTPTVTVKDSAGKTLKKDTDYTVSYASGRKNVGTYKVTVKMKGQYSGTKALTFTVTPTTKTSASLVLGKTLNIGAKSNTTIKYTTSNKSIATVSTKGVITAKKAGTVTISVVSGGITQKIKLTVKNPTVKITGTSSVVLKKSVTLKATTDCGGKITWSSSDKKIATVSSAGKVTGVKAGTATITAKVSYKGKTYKATFKVTVKNPTVKITGTSSMYLKQSVTLTATTNCGGTVAWSSSNKTVATVSSSGKVTGQKAGTATIYAKLTYGGKTYTASFKVTVKNPYLAKTSATLEKGKTVQITVKGGSGTITYTTSNKSVATVSSSGLVTAVGKGTCTITVKRNGYAMSFKVTVNEKDYSHITLYEDSNVRFSFKSAEKYAYSDDRAEVYLYVQNKTSSKKTIQCDAISLNGYSFCNVTMSDPVDAYSTGVVSVSVNEFDFSLVNINAITSIGGQFRVINSSFSSSYDAMFQNTRLDGKGSYSRTTAPNNKLLYSDSTCAIYYKDCKKDKYDEDEAELYLYLVNKTGRTLLIQGDAVSLNGYSFCNLTMSDPVIPYSVGIVNVTVNEFDYNLVNVASIFSVGGQFRIIDDATSNSYDAMFQNIRLDGTGTYRRTTAPNDKLLYSDSNCEIYYKVLEADKYDDDEAELYLYFVNKTNKTLLVQADTIVVNGYSFSSLIMSDEVIPGSVGIVNVSIDKFNYSAISLSNIRTIGGQLRIYDDAANTGYKITFASKSVS